MKIITNVGGNLDNIRRCSREQKNELLVAKLDTIQVALKSTIRPFKRYPVANQFLAWFKKIRSRYPFLVVEGASGTGKTVWVKWLLGDPSLVHECNCASCPEPELRQYDALVHKLILFDEASPEMVIRQKKLFQGPPTWVDLGMSTTNCHAYKVLVSGTRMVICSNDWTPKKQKMSPEDAAWLDANSFLINVGHEKMFLPES